MPMPTPQQLAVVDLFHGLEPRDLQQVAAQLRLRHWPEDSYIVNFRDDSRDVYFILSGKVRVKLYSEAGREVAFRDLEKGQSFGELSAIDQQPRSADVIALTDTEVVSVSAADFMVLFRSYPRLAENTALKLTALVRALSERVQEFAERVRVRVCLELIRMAEGSVSADGKSARLRPSPKHAEIAARCNTHREAVARLMGELTRLGIVQRGRGEIVINNLPALKDFSHRISED